MKMLRWMARVMRLDRNCNQDIRNRFGVASMSDKLNESRHRWYSLVLHAEEGTVHKVCLELDVSGKRPKGSSKQRWLDTLHADVELAGIHPNQTHDMA
ncbi:hypothetical protein ANCDUO_23346 [Ancylostoma duodenale]|uniref:Uncharacterized protein n=1 Tax=Ancylostoma duodenale TaxID=51022 RepID=A0A0C2FDH8_9BILA|nr:hypothetical protein ANCDUO_23346 [Ancylostoma duodenale]